ncbi:MAG: UDP-N-acetylmuramoyl-tripeptide--D-alanyl-D-alanine ligase [Baekduia sp.]
MRGWDAERIAAEIGPSARVVARDSAAEGPDHAIIDSRQAGPGALFFGLPGRNADGGEFAAEVLAAGAWGAVVSEAHAEAAQGAGALIACADPLAAMQRLATAWRDELGCVVIAITGSTGKTSTKDLTRAMAAQQRRVVATSQNLNTEIGLPLTILGAAQGTEVLVLELAMRGRGQIAELTAICRPDIGVIVNVGPVHLELLGTIEAIAETKCELIAGLAPGKTAVLPASEPLIEPYWREDLEIVTFGPGGDVSELPDGLTIRPDSAHMRLNALAALAACRAAGIEPAGLVEPELSAMRGQRIALAGGVTVIDDCYNANPMSMRAALDDLAASAPGRSVAVLGDMLELGPGEDGFHRALGEQARTSGVDVLITAGPLAAHATAPFGGDAHRAADAAGAAELAAALVRDGDTVLVKASRGIGLEVVAERLHAERGDG